MTRVITITLNPAVDLTATMETFTPGEVNRASKAQTNVGGKGINVAGCVADWGLETIASGVIGNANEELFTAFFAAKGIADHCIRVPGSSRTNVKISDASTGTTTDLNMPGLTLDERTIADLRSRIIPLITAESVVVLGGSLPPGLAADRWARLIEDLSGTGAPVVLDTSGAPLAEAMAPSSRHWPFAIKPNRAELEGLVGHALPKEADLLAAARELIARGVRLVVISLGSEGALFVTEAEALMARLPAKKVESTVGAGDAMVAGLVAGLAEKAALERIARLGVAFATSKLERVGPYLGSRDTVEALAAQVNIRKVETISDTALSPIQVA